MSNEVIDLEMVKEENTDTEHMAEESTPAVQEVVATPEATEAPITDATVTEAPTMQNTKDIVRMVASDIAEVLDGRLGEAIVDNVNLANVFETHESVGFLEVLFKEDSPVTLKTTEGKTVDVKFTINESFNAKLIAREAAATATDEALTAKVIKLAKGTFMEEFCANTSVQEAIVAEAEKKVVQNIKKLFKLWVHLLSVSFESKHNLIVEGGELSAGMSIFGLWTLDSGRNKDKDFYINPEFVSEDLNKNLKKYNSSKDEAILIIEKLGSISNEEVKYAVMEGISGGLDEMSSTISTTKNLIATCKPMMLEFNTKKEAAETPAVETDADIPEEV